MSTFKSKSSLRKVNTCKLVKDVSDRRLTLCCNFQYFDLNSCVFVTSFSHKLPHQSICIRVYSELKMYFSAQLLRSLRCALERSLKGDGRSHTCRNSGAHRCNMMQEMWFSV